MVDADFEKQTRLGPMDLAAEHAAKMAALEKVLALTGAERLLFDHCNGVTREPDALCFCFNPAARLAVQPVVEYLVWRGRVSEREGLVCVRRHEEVVRG